MYAETYGTSHLYICVSVSLNLAQVHLMSWNSPTASEVTSISAMTHENSHAKRWTRSLLEHLFNSYESYWTHYTGRAPTNTLFGTREYCKGEEQTTVLRYRREETWLVAWSGTKSAPFPRHCAAMWFSLSQYFPILSRCFIWCFVCGLVAKRILATVLKTTRNVHLRYQLTSDINSPPISTHLRYQLTSILGDLLFHY